MLGLDASGAGGRGGRGRDLLSAPACSSCPPALVTGQGAVRICQAVGGSGPDVERARRASSLPVRAGSRRAGIRGESAAAAQRATGMRGRQPPGRAQIQVPTRHARGSPPRCAAAPALRLFQPRSVGSAPMRGRASVAPVSAAVAAASVGRAQGGKPLNCHGRRPQLQGGDRAFFLATLTRGGGLNLHPCGAAAGPNA